MQIQESATNLLSHKSNSVMSSTMDEVEAVLEELHGYAGSNTNASSLGVGREFDTSLKEYMKDKERIFAFSQEIISNHLRIKEKMKKLEGPEASPQRHESPIALPVESYSSFMEEEILLESGASFRAYMFKEFKGCSSENLGVSLNWNLSEVLSNHVAAIFNWHSIHNEKAMINFKKFLFVLKAHHKPGRFDDLAFKREIRQ